MYKNIFKTVNKIDDDYYREEMKLWARRDFKMNKGLTDEVAIISFQFILSKQIHFLFVYVCQIDIKMQLSRARMSLTELETTIKMAK